MCEGDKGRHGRGQYGPRAVAYCRGRLSLPSLRLSVRCVSQPRHVSCSFFICGLFVCLLFEHQLLLGYLHLLCIMLCLYKCCLSHTHLVPHIYFTHCLFFLLSDSPPCVASASTF